MNKHTHPLAFFVRNDLRFCDYLRTGSTSPSMGSRVFLRPALTLTPSIPLFLLA